MSKPRLKPTAQAVFSILATGCLTNAAHAASFTVTGAMALARFNHAANLLVSNKVLISGGETDANNLIGAELYDAVAGTFATTGVMKNSRALHSGVRLTSGKVLLPGGWNGDAVITGTDLYDPVAATFAATAALSTARYSYGLTLLATGKALIAGGIDSDGIDLDSAAVYDPATGAWTATAAMATPRSQFTLTKLPTGKVLAVGGWDNTAELYDATTGLWTATGNAVVARHLHSAVLLNNGKVLLAGGNDGTATTATAELYDPSTGTFSATGNMAVARELHTLTLLPNGNVLATGGGDGNNGYLASAEVYNPTTGTWSATSSMAAPRQRHTATVLSTGKVLIAGGGTVNGATNAAEAYTPDAVAATCAITSGTNPSVIGRNVAFTALVSSANAVPTGTVTFKANGATKCATSLSAGRAMCAISDLTVGSNTVRVEYAGNFNFSPCNAQVVQNEVAFGVDLNVTNIVLTPTAPIAGGTFSAAVTVKNFGIDSGDGRKLSLWLNQPANLACDVVDNGLQQPVGVVAAQQTKTLTFPGLAAGVAGSKTFHAFVDSGCDTAENNEADNQLLKPYRVLPAAIGQADLVVTGMAMTPIAPLPNTLFKAWVTVKNQGTAAATAGQLSVWTNQATVQACNAVGNKTVAVTALDAGATAVLEVTDLASGTAGAKTLRAFVDSTCVTVEGSESNNQVVQSYTVATKPDFVVTNVVLTPAIPLPNTNFTAAVTVKNQGSAVGAAGFLDVWTNQAATQLCGADGEQYADAGTLLPGASRTLTFANLPAGAVVGAKKFLAFVDSWCTTPEAVEGNNQLTKEYPVSAPSCLAIKTANPTAPSGTYTIDLDGAGASAPFQVYCDMDTDGGGWTMVYKVTSGSNVNPNLLWNSATPQNEDVAATLTTTSFTNGYVNRIVTNFWNTSGVTFNNVRLHLYSSSAIKKFLKFNATGTTNISWYSLAAYSTSSWTDISTAGQNFFSITGDSTRTFFINRNYGGCSSDAGWIVATLSNSGCAWENSHPSKPALLYSNEPTFQNWTTGSIGVADVMAVFVR